jgi:LysR family hydrogen peroxide-inducible transcriptional activator
MNLRDLEYVVALADKKHFGLAAKACNVSQPALSSQIKKLEDYLGITLFSRTSKGVQSTEDAVLVVANARTILEKATQIRQHARYIARGQRPQLITLGVIPTIAPYYLPHLFKDMASYRGQQQLCWQLCEEKTDVLVEKLDRGVIDAAILVVPKTGFDHSQALLFEEELYLAMSVKHPLAKREGLSLHDIQDEDWLLLDEGHCLNTPIQDVCNKARVGVDRHSFRATSLETLRHMVALNSGVTLIPELARRKNDGIAYVQLKSSSRYKRSVSLVWRRDGLYADTISQIAKHLAGKR